MLMNGLLVRLADIASSKFDVTVVPQTLRKLIREGRNRILAPGPKPSMDESVFKNISAALSSYIAISQVNGDPEKDRSCIISALELLLKDKNTRAETIFKKFKKDHASILDVSKEQVREMRRLIWCTPGNLQDCFDEWEGFVITNGFATRNETGDVIFTEDQKRRIINIDETNLSLDGSDGGRGGRPSYSISIKGCQRPGTGQNKSGLSSSLMCGSNAAGEPMPLHIMFSSSASHEENYSVNPAWLVGLPRVAAKFGHDEVQCFPPTVTTNEKGGTDARVLAQVLKRYILTLFPDSADEPGKKVLIKIDGGPGRLDVVSLAELRTLGCYVFPGVQNTTHITQETDQNYGQFKSLLRKHIHLLLNKQYAQY